MNLRPGQAPLLPEAPSPIIRTVRLPPEPRFPATPIRPNPVPHTPMSEYDLMDKLVSLAKRRGYVFQSSEIYGGTGSVWDYGPLGIELKRNVKERWWSRMVHQRDDIEGLDAAILMHPRVWEASGHVEGFTDPLVECKVCKKRFRQDQLAGQECGRKPSKAPGEDDQCELGEPRMFNLMFRTFMGPVEDQGHVVYLRPETAQGSYVNFLNIQTASRQKVPFGVAQIGKAFRNEITPGNFIFRTREFEQAEMQFFVKPGTDEEWFEYWREERMAWHKALGVRAENLRFHEHGPDELAHYAKRAVDVEYRFSFGWKELEGIHNRTDFDLSRHQEYSGKRLEYIDSGAGERYLPFVVETAVGVDRTVLVLLADAYREEEVEGEQRVVLGLHPAVAPIKAAVFPLVKKDGLPEIATKLAKELREASIPSFYDESGSIGRRYRRQDEAGTPWCITVDGQTAEDGSVTVRDRDSLEQVRVDASQLRRWIAERLRQG
jgi:glycyl-tRNA synthetase